MGFLNLGKIKVLIKMKPGFECCLPTKAYESDSGYDLFAASKNDIIIPAGCVDKVPLGFSCAIPKGYELQIRPRSGLAKDAYISIINTPGTIDSGYRGEVCALVINLGKFAFHIKPGMKIAQGVFCKLPNVELVEIEEDLPLSDRDINGFGSTGV